MADLTGQTLDGRYRIDARIGRGGMAEVHIMNADGSGLIRLTDTPEWETSPSWSR
jgi:hypothetical protein